MKTNFSYGIKIGMLIHSRDGVGEPKKPPCVSCHHSGSNCVLAGSSRGGNFKFYEPSRKPGMASGTSETIIRSNNTHFEVSQEVSTLLSDASSDQAGDGTLNGDLDVQLRNPSDALHILAQAEGIDRSRPQTRLSMSAHAQDISASPLHEVGGPTELNTEDQPRSTLGDYYLIKEGQLDQKQVLELLSRYLQQSVTSRSLRPSLKVRLDIQNYTTHFAPSLQPT